MHPAHTIDDEPEAFWRILAHETGAWMLRREGTALVAYFDFCDWVRSQECASTAAFAKLFAPQATPAKGLPFSGWVGFFSYDFLAAQMGLTLRAVRDVPTPALCFGRPTAMLRMEAGGRTHIWAQEPAGVGELVRRAAEPVAAPAQEAEQVDFACNLDFARYRAIFHAAREEILNGNTYQIKISQRYEATCTPDALETFRRLDSLNPSPEAFVLKTDDFALVSCSPESVLHKRGSLVRTRPIGGTWERKGQADEQARLAAFVRNDKELCEHNMLVDLERNDLARVCQAGTVHIERLREIEPYAHVYHLVSTIVGELKNGIRPEALLASMLPGGSITGCPKWRTMELIDGFEPVARGAYTGSFGTLADNGDMDLNLIIRTLVLAQGKAYAQAGGGIVVDSTPEYEYRENALKAQALLEVCLGKELRS